MKKFTIIFGLICISIIALPQACPIITDAFFTSTATGSSLSITYTGNGQKHIEYFISCNGAQISSGCIDTKGSGTTLTPEVQCTGELSWVLVPGTGTCINGTTCGDTVRSPSGGPLPVVMGNFTVQRKSNNVAVNWQTQQEINLKSFEIQRASGNQNYITVGKVSAH
jgi:hypothetical protein